MTCEFCSRQVGEYDWGYMIDENESIVYAHLDCFAWEEAMERAETIDYLSTVLA